LTNRAQIGVTLCSVEELRFWIDLVTPPSVVTSLFNSARYVEEFYHRILAQLQKINCEYEVVFVDDGSPDQSLDVALEIAQRDPKVCVVELSRNFGHHKALMTGLEMAKGELVFLIDVDLEEPPEVLTLFYQKLQECSADMIFGVHHLDLVSRRIDHLQSGNYCRLSFCDVSGGQTATLSHHQKGPYWRPGTG
jgi:glycosyltransferase involved in cell wall biosynthesis